MRVEPRLRILAVATGAKAGVRVEGVRGPFPHRAAPTEVGHGRRRTLPLDFARQALKRHGDMVVKVFQGAGSDAYLKDLRTSFDKVLVRKPAASRPRSREVYVVAKGLRAK